MSHELFRDIPFPYPDDKFPENLGCVVSLTVASGQEPARIIIHDSEGDWLIGDCTDGASDHDNLVLSGILHIVAHNTSLAEFASLPSGYQESRHNPGCPWEISPFAYEDDDLI